MIRLEAGAGTRVVGYPARDMPLKRAGFHENRGVKVYQSTRLKQGGTVAVDRWPWSLFSGLSGLPQFHVDRQAQQF